MLSKLWKNTGLQSIPIITDQPSWNLVAEDFKKQLFDAAEQYVDYEWPALPATRYMDFIRNGNRDRYESSYFKRRQALAILVVAECLEGKGRFLDDIINGVWCICEESSWVLPAHHNQFYAGDRTNPLPRIQEQVIDLFAAETGVLLAWTKHLLADSLDTVAQQVNERIVSELKNRILGPYLERDDFWWMGLKETDNTLGNWVPWTTGNCLRTFLLAERDADRRFKALNKALLSLDKYLEEYSPDGGCDEGPSYWGRSGGSLFECLEMLYDVSNGVFDPFQIDLVKRIGQYMYKVHIAGDYYVNFADGSAKAEVEGPILFSYGQRIGDRALMSLGAQMYQNTGLAGILKPQTFSIGRVIRAALLHEELNRHEVKSSVPRSHWLDNLQVMAARETSTPERGFFMAAKGGHNGENHNHNDIGSCIVFHDGQPLIIDVGVETYTARTFSPQRYEIWTMQSGYHNLPIINGIEQAPGRNYKATNVEYANDEVSTQVSLNISQAYPTETGVKSWIRSYRLERQPQPKVVINDQYSLQYAHQLKLAFMLAQEPRIQGNAIELSPEKHLGEHRIDMIYDTTLCSVSYEPIAISDARLQPVWGDTLYRLIFQVREPNSTGNLRFQIKKRE